MRSAEVILGHRVAHERIAEKAQGRRWIVSGEGPARLSQRSHQFTFLCHYGDMFSPQHSV